MRKPDEFLVEYIQNGRECECIEYGEDRLDAYRRFCKRCSEAELVKMTYIEIV